MTIHTALLYYREGSGPATFTQGERQVLEYTTDEGTRWSWRSGRVKLADGTILPAVLHFCDTDSGEHYDTLFFGPHGPVFQDDQNLTRKLERTGRDIFPYRYDYDGVIPGDIHEHGGF